ncbi:hypothetical protein [Sphingomonas sp. NIC1]|uniref:hypothetical protein n=1 Tax=Sphingomonas sp. NIC1 TaxID=1961362 RepID=UPI0007C0FD32|nr:hypothetical protein [Sphingomonas sp. NIC1]ANC88642.1 hypothetical protein A7E77_16885 [Sphingomonas sp. NIC1]
MTGAVGIFWMVDDVLVAAGCELEDAARYGDCLTFDGGHAEHWERWQEAGGHWLAKNGLPARILTTEYDEHPRGRIVKEPGGFVLYADQRLQSPARITAICERFGLGRAAVLVRSDPHYRRAEAA